jgi:hypothetical protein
MKEPGPRRVYHVLFMLHYYRVQQVCDTYYSLCLYYSKKKKEKGRMTPAIAWRPAELQCSLRYMAGPARQSFSACLIAWQARLGRALVCAPSQGGPGRAELCCEHCCKAAQTRLGRAKHWLAVLGSFGVCSVLHGGPGETRRRSTALVLIRLAQSLRRVPGSSSLAYEYYTGWEVNRKRKQDRSRPGSCRPVFTCYIFHSAAVMGSEEYCIGMALEFKDFWIKLFSSHRSILIFCSMPEQSTKSSMKLKTM